MSFEKFLIDFLGQLARDDFNQGRSFSAYLDRPVGERGGDEADIVDLKVTQTLLRALGFQDGEIEYNRAGAQGTRPDFKVSIPEYPRPCFIVEDKNTTEERLLRHAPQLEGYMRSYGAPRGILIDGRRLIAFDVAEAELTTSSDISLYNLVRAWRGESIFASQDTGAAALGPAERLQLHAFYARYSREAYANSTRLVEDLTRTRDGKWHAPDGSTWPSASVIPVVNANDNIDTFIENIRALIAEVQLDVEAQVNLRLDEHATYEEQLAVNPDDPRTSLEDAFSREVSVLIREAAALGLPQAVQNSVRDRLNAQYHRQTLRSIATTIKGELKRALSEQEAKRSIAADKAAGETKNNANSLFDGSPAPTGRARGPSRKKTQSLPAALDASLIRLERIIGTHNEQKAHLEEAFAAAIATQSAYQLWHDKVATVLMRTADEQRLRKEFAAQTAYVLIIRLLLIRISEDKGILDRMFTNGGLSVWFRDVEPRYLKYAQGRGTDYLLEMAYASAQHVYKHFYSQRELFDWYRPDRNLVIKVLHRLAGYDLQRIDHDLIGHIYSGYVQDEHKHETGMYYTPPEVVEYMLDRIGWRGSRITGSRLLDPACGSGTFLVVAARRLLEAHRAYYKTQGHADIPVSQIQHVLYAVRDSIYGLDLNPFACYLAETNLLVQVLDELKRALDASHPVTLDRFNVHNTDTLRYDPATQGVTSGTLAFPAEHLPVAEQIKARVGRFAEGFDYVVGNPPYVRADEQSEGLAEYRETVKTTHPIPDVRAALQMKWDLFVPFMALSQYLLRGNGRMAMITSDSIEGNAYAKPLRDWLTSRATVDEISFFPQVKLFSDAGVSNTITITTNSAPDPTHKTTRLWHSGPPPAVTKTDELAQTEAGEQVFRQRTASLMHKGAVPLGSICYVTTGMVIHADEKRFKGAFGKDELISPQQSDTHPKPFVEGKDIEPYEVTSLKYLEYGEGLRAPEKIRRPTFPELYDRPKLIAQRVVSTNAANNAQLIIDLGAWGDSNDFLTTTEGGVLVLPWASLAGVKNRSLEKKASESERRLLEKRSAGFDLLYIAGVLNSGTINDLLRNSRRDRSNIYPADFEALPVPQATPDQQEPIVTRVQKLHEHSMRFLALREAGWVLDLQDPSARSPIVLAGHDTMPLASAKVRWGLSVFEPDKPVGNLTVSSDGLHRGKRLAIGSASPISEKAWGYLARAFAGLPSGTTFTAAEAQGFLLPTDPNKAEAVFTERVAAEKEVAADIARWLELRREVDELVAALFNSA